MRLQIDYLLRNFVTLSSRSFPRTGRTAALFSLMAVLSLAAAPDKKLAVYSTAANYSLPIMQRGGQDYVGLLELLDPLGSVSAKPEGSRWKLKYGNILAEFNHDKSKARIQGRDADLGQKFFLENGRGLVAVSSLPSLLPRLLGGPATLHEEAGRLFIGNVATHFTAVVAANDPSQLVFHFTAPVSPTISIEPGTIRITFGHDAVTGPASPTLTFGSRIVPSAAYSEANGSAQISVVTKAPLAANISADGRTITLAPASTQTAAATAPAISGQGSNPQAAASLPAATPASANPIPRRYFVVVDASHGGSDRGEALSATLAEKDVTLAMAHLLRQELESRGMNTLILRDSDANLSLDERGSFANTTHAALYVAIHAASSGHGVRLYTAMMPFSTANDHGPFRDWSTAQSGSEPVSQLAANSVADTLRKIQVPVRALTAPLRPLNNIVTAAIAVEIAPPAADVAALASPDYQQLIAGAVANGIQAVRGQLGATP